MSHNITIDDKLYNELKEYCDLNKLKVSNLCCDLLKKSLNELKYGDIPFGIVVKPVVTQINQELVPVQPMSFQGEPLGKETYESKNENMESEQEMRQESRQDVAIPEKKEEIKTKPKRTRVLN